MINSIIEQQVQNAAQELLDDKTIKILKGVRRIASKQGGENAIENYQLLGKRTLIVLGITIVAVQAVSSAVGFVVSRKSEEQRIERIVRRERVNRGAALINVHAQVQRRQRFHNGFRSWFRTAEGFPQLVDLPLSTLFICTAS